MLASSNVDLISQQSMALPLLVQLPAHMANFFTEVGYMPSTYVEKRAHARVRVRCESIITIVCVPPFVHRGESSVRVLVKDLSRGGISILSHQQMWPTETFVIDLHKRKLSARVVRCRKLGDCCYEVGAVVFSIEASR